MSEPHVQHRKRARVACEACRQLKRKCDGAQPCGACVRFEYTCTYDKTDQLESTTRVRQRRRIGGPALESQPLHGASPSTGPSPTFTHGDTSSPLPALSSGGYLRSLEANSGAAFVRRLALGIDPKNAPRMHLFAWNAFLDARQAVGTPTARPIREILTQEDMLTLRDVYFKKIDQCYGFIDRAELDRHIESRWATRSSSDYTYDAVLCGVAALGCLFSHIQPLQMELDLMESARTLLERALYTTPSATIVTAWVLRVSYLRMAGTPHAAWMASGILVHLVESAGLHYEPVIEGSSILQTSSEGVDPEIRRQLFGLAQHLNIWISFDLGRSRVALPNATTILPSPRRGNCTLALLELLPYSALLDPDRAPNAAELQDALITVAARTHVEPPSVLAQCNLTLCIYRRLRSLNVAFDESLLAQVLEVARRGVRAARRMVEDGTPWHHMANVPFQVVCVLLAIDTPASLAQLGAAVDCLHAIAATYHTEATQEALRTASLLIQLHRRRKEKSVAELSDMLKLYPASNAALPAAPSAEGSSANPPDKLDMGYLDSLMAEIPSLEDFDLDQLLSQGFDWRAG
ncbi:protein RDR1 [Xylariales sp. PMI_506]|nr:protein RDR1 [Xylariales sp. PMI_506]